MPRKAKNEEKDEVRKVAKTTNSNKKTTKESKTKKASASKVATQKKTAAKKSSTSKKTNTKSKVSAKDTKKKSSATKNASSKAKSTAKTMLAEYYDLPYGYNETTVKILAQTPTTLFVYWDISEQDRNNLIDKYGNNFFYETRPILIVHNLTKNYSFEIEINDFANSWYIRCQEPDCDYEIELGRKNVDKPEEYIYIDSSNDIVSPNDHILFEKSDLGNVRFKNVKTGSISTKDFGSLRFINNIDRLYGNIYDVYSMLYNNETLNELTNPSSGEFIMK